MTLLKDYISAFCVAGVVFGGCGAALESLSAVQGCPFCGFVGGGFVGDFTLVIWLWWL